MGDGALAKFGTALDAVNCAVEIQELARAKFDGKLRIGIHSGDITLENDNVYGDGVNIASRLESITDPGGIYISESIEKAIQGQTDVQAKYLGEVKLKNVAYGVRTYAVQGVGLPVPDVKEDKELSGHLWAEVQRKSIIRAAISYMVVALLLVLLWDKIQDLGIALPGWSFTLLMATLGVGFPVGIYLAWNFERSPEEFVRTTSQQSWQNPLKPSQRKPLTDSFIIAGLALMIIIMYFYPRLSFSDQSQQLTGSTLEPTAFNKSIAVLPFNTITKDSTSQYIAEGVKEAILNNLFKIKKLQVGSRTSAETYRNSPKRIPEIASELGVATILEGSAQKFGDKIRITVQLIDGKTDNHLWSEEYDRDWGDIFAIYTEIAEKVAAALQIVITPEEKQQIATTPTTNVTAYDYILKAREEQKKYWFEGDTIALKRAVRLYTKVLKLDSAYALGWVKLGSIYYDRHQLTEEYYKKNYLDSVLWYCDRAIAVNSNEAEAYFLADIVFHKRDNIEQTIKNYEKAVDLTQHDTEILNVAVTWESLWRLGLTYVYKKDYINGISLIRKAVQVARVEPQSYSHLLHRLGYAYTYIEAYEEAEDYILNSKSLGGDSYRLCYFYAYQGDFEASIDCTTTCCQVDSTNSSCNFLSANINLQLREFETSLKYFREFREVNEKRGFRQFNNLYREGFSMIQMRNQKVNIKLIEQQLILLDKRNKLGRPDGHDYHYAAIYASLGDQDRALQHLRDYQEKSFYPNWRIIPISFSQHDIMFENLWDNEEFQAIVRRDQEEKAAARLQVREIEERRELDL